MKDPGRKAALAVGVTVLAAAITAAGFGAWVITGTTSFDFSGNVQVEGVVGDVMRVEIGAGQENQSISYSSPAEAVNADGWLRSDGQSAEQLVLEYDLTFTGVVPGRFVSLELSAADGKSNAVYESRFEGCEDRPASYAAAVEAGYIKDISQSTVKTEDLSEGVGVQKLPDGELLFTFGESDEPYTAHLTITFMWGDAFNNANPYYMYKDYTDPQQQLQAADTLAYIEACLSEVTFKVRFVPLTEDI